MLDGDVQLCRHGSENNNKLALCNMQDLNQYILFMNIRLNHMCITVIYYILHSSSCFSMYVSYYYVSCIPYKIQLLYQRSVIKPNITHH